MMMRLGRRGGKTSGSSSNSTSSSSPAASRKPQVRGATELKEAILKVIAETKPGAQRPMSTNEMTRIAMEMGIAAPEAKKVPTQIRRGGPLHNEWKAAFSSGRFFQKNGRPPRTEGISSGTSEEADEPPLLQYQLEYGPKKGKRDRQVSAAEMMDEDSKEDDEEYAEAPQRREPVNAYAGGEGGGEFGEGNRMCEIDDDLDAFDLDDPEGLEDLLATLHTRHK